MVVRKRKRAKGQGEWSGLETRVDWPCKLAVHYNDNLVSM